MIRETFEQQLADYVRGALSEHERIAFELHASQHPELSEEVDGMREILGLAEQFAIDVPPPHLYAAAADSLLRNSRDARRRAGTRRGFAWAAAVVVVVSTMLGLWPGSGASALAEMLQRLRESPSYLAEGWILGENGARVAFRQWVTPRGSRTEIGTIPNVRVVMDDGAYRWIQTPDGRYREPITGRRGTSPRLFAMTAEDVKGWGYDVTRTTTDQGIRYSIRPTAALGGGPADFLHIVDVDPERMLPTRIQVQESVSGDWTKVSDLWFSGFHEPFPEVRTSPSTTVFAELSPTIAARLWYERTVTPWTSLQPARVVPRDGIKVLQGQPRNETRGWSRVHVGGVTEVVFHEQALSTVVGRITGLPVVVEDGGDRTITGRVLHKTVLPPDEILSAVLDAFSAHGQLEQRTIDQRRFVVSPPTTGPATSASSRYTLSVTNLEGGGRRFEFRAADLYAVVGNLLSNASDLEFSDKDDVVYRRDATMTDPFEVRIDLRVETKGSSWKEISEVLWNRLGIEVGIEATRTTGQVIVLSK